MILWNVCTELQCHITVSHHLETGGSFFNNCSWQDWGECKCEREWEKERERERERESIICQHNGQGIMIVPNGTNKLKFQRKGSGKKRFIFSELFFPGCDVAVKKTLAQLFWNFE